MKSKEETGLCEFCLFVDSDFDLTVFSGKTHAKYAPSNFLHWGDYVRYGLKERIRHHLS